VNSFGLDNHGVKNLNMIALIAYNGYFPYVNLRLSRLFGSRLFKSFKSVFSTTRVGGFPEAAGTVEMFQGGEKAAHDNRPSELLSSLLQCSH